MSRVQKIVLAGTAGIVGFDVLASLASRTFDFPYVNATLGSLLIYGVVGFAIGRVAPMRYAMAGVVAVGIVEATIGWWLSWIIGPGRPVSGTIYPAQAFRVVISTMVVAAIIGAVAGLLGRSHPRGRTA
jgi:hypothetical protein